MEKYYFTCDKFLKNKVSITYIGMPISCRKKKNLQHKVCYFDLCHPIANCCSETRRMASDGNLSIFIVCDVSHEPLDCSLREQ